MEVKPLIYQFDDVRVDLNTFKVFKAGSPLHLEPKAFEALVFLIENRGRLIEKEELLNAVWREAFVTQGAMTRVIAQLRKALADSHKRSKYLETVPTRGYRFIAEVKIGEITERRALEQASLRPVREQIRSIALLPLENTSGDPGQEYFADGMTDLLITELAKIGAFRVISRTSVMQYKMARKPLPEIARELNVDAVVQGTALRIGNRVRICAQLLHAATDQHIWAETYDSELGDPMELQSKVARAIATEVKVKLTRQEEKRLTAARAVNSAACEAYLKGMYYFYQGRDKIPAVEGVELVRKASEFFGQAIKIQPDYALAYASLSRSYHYLASYGIKELFCQSKATAIKALQIDDTLAEAHGALGYTLLKYEWDWLGAEREHSEAVELSPSYSDAHHGYAIYLSAVGRHTEAIREVRIAEELDPFNLTARINAGLIYGCAGDSARATEQLRQVIELNPDISFARWALGSVHTLNGEFAAALRQFQRGMALSGRDALSSSGFGHACALSGRTEEARMVLSQLKQDSEHYYHTAYLIAIIHAGLREEDQAFQWLEKAYEERSDHMIWLKVDGRLDTLRSNPRFEELLRRVRLAQ